MNVLFVWIPRTGGTSLFDLFRRPPIEMRKIVDGVKRIQSGAFDNQGSVTFGHCSIRHLVKQNVVSLKYVEDAYKVVFVRNPWDRLASLHRYYLLHKPRTVERNAVHTLDKLVNVLESRGFDGLGPRNVRRMTQANPMTAWFRSLESCGVSFDFVGRFENYEQEVRRLFDLLGVDCPSIPHENKTRHTRIDAALVERVGRLYAEDIQRFNYTFP